MVNNLNMTGINNHGEKQVSNVWPLLKTSAVDVYLLLHYIYIYIHIFNIELKSWDSVFSIMFVLLQPSHLAPKRNMRWISFSRRLSPLPNGRLWGVHSSTNL